MFWILCRTKAGNLGRIAFVPEEASYFQQLRASSSRSSLNLGGSLVGAPGADHEDESSNMHLDLKDGSQQNSMVSTPSGRARPSLITLRLLVLAQPGHSAQSSDESGAFSLNVNCP